MRIRVPLTLISVLTRSLIVAAGIWTFAPVAARAQSLAPDLLGGLLIPDSVFADSSAAALDQPAGPPPTPEHTGFTAMALHLVQDFKHLPASENLWWAATGGGLALAVHPADTHVTHYFVNASWAHGVFVFGAYLGDTPELLAISGTVYAVGRFKGDKKVSHVGEDLLESIVVSEAIVNALKYTTHRGRPDGSSAKSFASGHASDTFAVATALERHLGWKGAVPGYIFASYVAMSRLHDNRHYLSDVVFGATTGIIAGRTVTRHGREFPVAVIAVPGGAEIAYHRGSP